MPFEYDERKDRLNVEKHGISLSRLSDLIPLKVVDDARREYFEVRYKVFGYIDGLAYCGAYTLRGENIRAISLRRAHAKEMRQHGL